MISIKELLEPGVEFSKLPVDVRVNLLELCKRLNIIRDAYGKPMTVTSGLRDMDKHLAIYKAKGITDPAKIPMKSKHLFGQAADIFDPKQQLQQWCLKSITLLESTGLWCEDFSATPTWVHFQIVPPKSGNRFFKP